MELPIGHLQLGKRAHRSCLDLHLESIQQVAEGLESGRLNRELVGAKTFYDICEAIASVRSMQDSVGSIDWPSYWNSHEIAAGRLFMTSRALESLAPEVRKCSICSLHLGKACSGLRAGEINTVGRLVDAARAGIPKIKNFGKKAHAEVAQALKTLSFTSSGNGTVDWIVFAEKQGYEIIPANPAEEGEDGAGSFVEKVLAVACKHSIMAQFKDREWNIFKRRLLVSKEETETLQTIGDVYGITRERVRQIEALCLDALRRPLIYEDYRKLNCRFRPEFGGYFKAAADHFKTLGLVAWRKERWIEELAQVWHTSANRLAERYRLVAEILGYKSVRFDKPDIDALVVDQKTPDREVRRLMTLVELVHQTLSAGKTMDAFSVVKALHKHGGSLATLHEVPFLIELCSTAEAVEEDLYRLRFKNLRGRANQAVRVLEEVGKPLHHDVILREINRRLPPINRLKNSVNLVNQISPDERLQTIGKSGKWALAEWGVETRSIVDLMEEVLTSAGEAMHVDDLADQVLRMRPGSKASFALLLGSNPGRFRKVAPHMYALASWGDLDRTYLLDQDDIARFVADFLHKSGRNDVLFSELREAFSKHSGLAERSARGVLAQHPAVEVDRPDFQTRIARYDPAWKSKPRRSRTRSKPLQVDVITDAAKSMLHDAPTGERPLIEIVTEIENQLNIIRPNIYAAIDQSGEIEKISVEGSAFKICRLVGRSYANFPQLSKLMNADWRAECSRAIGKLTLEDVDIGLFLVGRQFDSSMALLLETARDYSNESVTGGNLAKLHNRIDWAVARGVLKDKATLMLLKSERNERGHQPPSIEERRAIMKFAPFLAGLYIDYLIMIDEQIRKIKETGSL